MITKKLNTLFLTFLIGTNLLMAQTTWTVDQSHSKIGFSVTHMAVSEVDGKFNEFTATVKSSKDDFDGAKVDFTAQVASVDTDNEKRDGHLKSDDFFGAKDHPEITFKGTLKKIEGKKYKLEGDFTMKGVTKKVSFDVTYGGTIDTGKGVKSGFKVKGEIDRQDYGVSWNSNVAGELAVGDDVTIECKIELNKA